MNVPNKESTKCRYIAEQTVQDIRKHPQERTAKCFHKREKPKDLSTEKGKTCSSVFSYDDVKSLWDFSLPRIALKVI